MSYLEDKLRSVENMTEVYEGHKDHMISYYNKRAIERESWLDACDDNTIISTQWVLKNSYTIKTKYTNMVHHSRFISYLDEQLEDTLFITVGTEKEEAILMRSLDVEVRDSYKKDVDPLHLAIYKEKNNGALIINTK